MVGQARTALNAHATVLHMVCSRGIGFQPVILFLLKPDRLEAYPTCLASVDHTQTDRAHRAGWIDDCRVMIVDFGSGRNRG